MRKIFSLILVLTFTLNSCSQLPPRTEYVLGTACTINLYEQGSQKKYDELFARLHELDSILSANSPNSNLAEINDAAGIHPVKTHPEIITILNTALLYSEKTNGAFDPSIGPLVKEWNIGFASAKIPDQKHITEALRLINYKDIKINDSDNTVFLSKKGMKLDLGAIAKGFAADDLVSLCKKWKIKHAILDLGGNIYAFGEKKKGTPWTVGIRDPYNESNKPIASLQVTNQSVVTSGVYERFFEQDGIRYHHILDTQTGFPVENNLVSVTIISPVSMLADTLSTSVFALGSEKGKALVEGLSDCEAIFIFSDQQIETTKGLENSLKLLTEEFRIRQ